MIKKSKIFNISAKYYDYIYKKKKYLKETNFVSQFFPSNKKKLNILDLGMGTGNHLINLIKKGHKVDGVELSSDMIRLAKEKVKKKNIYKNYKFYNDDIVRFKGKKNNYDIALSLFHVLNYINDYNALEKFFSNIHNTLKDSGIFLFDCWNNEIVKKKKLKNTKKIIFFKNYKIIRNGNIVRKVKSKIEVSYTFRIYKKNKLIDIFYEKHNLCSFTKSQILKATKNKFLLINNCTWFNEKKSPSTNDFSSFFIFKKKLLKI
jgi:SAM-dependent methyltransferase